MNMKATAPQLPLALTMEHFEKGQCPNPPMTSSCVLKIVSTDPNFPSEKEIRMSQSITSDLVYITTKGFIKPAKHLQMGVGLKHLTGSEKVGRILSSYGHSISTTQEKEIITEMGIAILEKKISFA